MGEHSQGQRAADRRRHIDTADHPTMRRDNTNGRPTGQLISGRDGGAVIIAGVPTPLPSTRHARGARHNGLTPHARLHWVAVGLAALAVALILSVQLFLLYRP